MPVDAADEFLSVWFAGANDGWAVGRGDLTNAVVHWTGRRWTVVPSAEIADGGVAFYDVAGRAATDVWAVGGSTPEPGTGASTALIEHWNGRRWLAVKTPVVGYSVLFAVNATSVDDVWAVGVRRGRTLIEHWDGQSWTISPSPVSSGTLNDVAATSAHDVWAAGDTGSAPLLEHWDGARWRRIAVPVRRGSLTSVAAVSAGDVWVAGGGGALGSVIVEHRVGKVWHKARPAVSKRYYGATAMAVAAKDSIWLALEGEGASAIAHYHC